MKYTRSARRFVTLVIVALLSVCVESEPKRASTVTGGSLETFSLAMPQFGDARTRTIRVWLPDGYDANDLSRRYSVLYMHDGQNLFDSLTSFIGEWRVDESLSALFSEGAERTIVVGIDNGAVHRANELSPDLNRSAVGRALITAPEGDAYAAFVAVTVKTYIDSHFNTKPEREYTSVGGSSMGGIMSFYLAMEYPSVYSRAIVFSPALQVYADGEIEEYIGKVGFAPAMPDLYIFAGGATGGSPAGSAYDEACIEKYPAVMEALLRARGYPGKIGVKVDPSRIHHESVWAEYFPVAWRYLTAGK